RSGTTLAGIPTSSGDAPRPRTARRARSGLDDPSHTADSADNGGDGSLLHRHPRRARRRDAGPLDPVPDLAAAVTLVEDADDGDAGTARRPAEVEPNCHPLAQAVDARNGAEDRDEGISEGILPARRFAAQSPALTTVVDPGDDPAVVAITAVGDPEPRGDVVRLVRHAPDASTARAATAASSFRPTRSTNIGKVSPGSRRSS